VSRVKRTIPLPAVLSHYFENIFSVFLVAATPRIVRISATDQQGVIRLLGKNSDVIIAVVLGLAFDQAKFGVTMS
jgi:hypothetical protein